MMHFFSASASLKVNFNKSSLVPINVPDGEALKLSTLFDCKMGTMPFTYLGLLVAATRLGRIYSLWWIGWRGDYLLALLY